MQKICVSLIIYPTFLQEKTLIPILDFCNHSNTPNAYWVRGDLASGNGDVHLMMTADDVTKVAATNQDQIEITINYGNDMEREDL